MILLFTETDLLLSDSFLPILIFPQTEGPNFPKGFPSIVSFAVAAVFLTSKSMNQEIASFGVGRLMNSSICKLPSPAAIETRGSRKQTFGAVVSTQCEGRHLSS